MYDAYIEKWTYILNKKYCVFYTLEKTTLKTTEKTTKKTTERITEETTKGTPVEPLKCQCGIERQVKRGEDMIIGGEEVTPVSWKNRVKVIFYFEYNFPKNIASL